MKRYSWVALLAVVLGVTLSGPAAAGTRLRLATLAPKNSSWGKVFKVWQEAVSRATAGGIELDVYYNAVQGNEASMVGKMKTGQLDGAALTSVGLSGIYRNVLILQLPGVMTKWEELDKVRAALEPDMNKGFLDAGFEVLGWGDIGLVRQFSKGFAVRRPEDVKGKRPVVWREEPMGPVIYATIGGVVPVPLGPPEVLPALQAGSVNIVNAPALAAEQLQWVPHFDHVSTQVSVCAIGGTVFRKKALEDLPADVRDKFYAIQKKLMSRNTDRIRTLDNEAFDRVKKKMDVVVLSEADRESWRKILDQSVKKLAQGTFDRGLVNRVLALRGMKQI